MDMLQSSYRVQVIVRSKEDRVDMVVVQIGNEKLDATRIKQSVTRTSANLCALLCRVVDVFAQCVTFLFFWVHIKRTK